MKVVTVHAAKTHLSRLIERAEAGEEIVIARNKQPVARLVRIDAVPRCGNSVPCAARHASRPPFEPSIGWLIAQARLEGMRVVTNDQVFDAFGVERFW